MLNWKLYPNFTEDELRCKCGCGRADMDPAFMEWLQELRNILGKPMVITSGFRCPDHNEVVSKSGTGRTGPHTTGCAIDIAVAYEPAYELMALAIRGVETDVNDCMYLKPATGVGARQHGNPKRRFVHLDCIDLAQHPRFEYVRPMFWSYP